MPRSRKKLTKEQAARKLTALAMEHLSQLPPAERDARIKAFGRTVAKLRRKPAKSANPSVASRGHRRTQARG